MKATLCLFLALAAFCPADTIRLSSGQEIHAAVTKYRNGSFEARSADGKSTTYASTNIKQIQFDPRSAPSKLVTRNNGTQEGTIVAFENSGFVMTQAGARKTFPAIFVERAEIEPDRGPSVQLITRGQQVDIKRHLALGN